VELTQDPVQRRASFGISGVAASGSAATGVSFLVA
jgi:hypothetical protein